MKTTRTAITHHEFWDIVSQIERKRDFDMFADNAPQEYGKIILEVIEKLACKGCRITGKSNGMGIIKYALHTSDGRQIEMFIREGKGHITEYVKE